VRRRAWLALAMSVMLSGCAVVDKMSGEGEAKRIRRVGQSADAEVLEIRDTGITVNDDPVVAFRLRVRPVSGTPYEVETRGRVGRLDVPQVQPGAVLPVAIDPLDPKKVALRIYRDQ
jgi:hypothetical protein